VSGPSDSLAVDLGPRGFWIAWESQSSVWYQKLLLLRLLQALRKMLKKHSPSIAFTSSARLRTSSLMLRNQDRFESMFLAHPNQWSLSIPARVQKFCRKSSVTWMQTKHTLTHCVVYAG